MKILFHINYRTYAFNLIVVLICCLTPTQIICRSGNLNKKEKQREKKNYVTTNRKKEPSIECVSL